jgi:hypothetical protein
MLAQLPSPASSAEILDSLARSSPAELRERLNWYVDSTLRLIAGLGDDQIVQVPRDPQADDQYAASEEERYAGWSLAHVVLHITASAEEGAAFSSILARGIPIGGRLRHEQDWRQVTRTTELVVRLEECRRICLAYLDTWPEPPHLETLRLLPEQLSGLKVNAPLCFLGGLRHWEAHMEQLERGARQHPENTTAVV